MRSGSPGEGEVTATCGDNRIYTIAVSSEVRRCRAEMAHSQHSSQGQHTLVCSAAFQRTHHHPLNTTSTVCYYCVRPSGGSRHGELPRLSRNIHVRETKHSVPLHVELSAHIEKRRKHARLPPSGTVRFHRGGIMRIFSRHARTRPPARLAVKPSRLRPKLR